MKPTDPALWNKIRAKARASSVGGEKGRWSPRKQAMARRAYEKQGGGWRTVQAPKADANLMVDNPFIEIAEPDDPNRVDFHMPGKHIQKSHGSWSRGSAWNKGKRRANLKTVGGDGRRASTPGGGQGAPAWPGSKQPEGGVKPLFNVKGAPVYDTPPKGSHHFVMPDVGKGLYYDPSKGFGVTPQEVAGAAGLRKQDVLGRGRYDEVANKLRLEGDTVDTKHLKDQLARAYPGVDKYTIRGEEKDLREAADPPPPKPEPKPAPRPEPKPEPKPEPPKPDTGEPDPAFKIGKLQVYGGDPKGLREVTHRFAIGKKDGKPTMLFFVPDTAKQMAPDYIQRHALKKGAFDEFLGSGHFFAKGGQHTKPGTPNLDGYVRDNPEIREALREAYPDAPEYRHGMKARDLETGESLEPEPKPAPKPEPYERPKPKVTRGKKPDDPVIRIDRKPVYEGQPGKLAGGRHDFAMGKKDGKPTMWFYKEGTRARDVFDELSDKPLDQDPDAIEGSITRRGDLVLTRGVDREPSKALLDNLAKAYPDQEFLRVRGEKYALRPGSTTDSPKEGVAFKASGEDVYERHPGGLKDRPHRVVYGYKDGEPKILFTTAAGNETVVAGLAELDGGIFGPRTMTGMFSKVDGLSFTGSEKKPTNALMSTIKEAYPDLKEFKYNDKTFPMDFNPEAKVVAPVSAALPRKGGATGKMMNKALDAIDDIHTDGDLPNIPLKTTRSMSKGGHYKYRAGRAVEIALNPKTADPLTAAHEVGHFLDHQALGEWGRYDSKSPASPEMVSLMSALRESKAAKTIRDMLNEPSKYTKTKKYALGSGREYEYTERPDRNHLTYLDSSQEMFARGYAQWIAEKSKDPALQKGVDDYLARGNGVYYPWHWEADDFAPIRKAFDDLFAAQGWLK